MAEGKDVVPSYFHNFTQDFARFREENAQQHGSLAERISAAEVRTTRWMVGALLTVAGIVSGAGVGAAFIVVRLAA